MRNHFLKLVTDSEIEQIRNAAMKILCSEGVTVQNRYLLEKCEEKGLKVDYPRQKVQVTPEIWSKLEERALASATGQSSELIARRYGNGLYDKANQPEVIRRSIPKGYKLGRDIPSRYDFKEGKKRPATLADNNEMIKALHMLPEVQAIAPLFISQDLEPLIEPVISLANAFKLSDKPFAELALIEVNADTLALELIEQIGVNGNFLEADHTYAHFRGLWNPKLMDRSSYTSDETEKGMEAQILEAAQAKYDDAVSGYVPPQIDGAKHRAYDAVVEKAKRALLQ